MSAGLRIAALHGGYGDSDILTGVEFAVAPGEIVALGGPNGCGKSTLVKAIMGLLPRWRGTMTIDGLALAGRRAEERVALGIGYVPQVANVFAALSVRENLLVVRGLGTTRAAQVERVLTLFPALRDRLAHRASSLSGGERQQLAFARALMARPRLLILDEPTANLAPALVGQVLSLVAALPREGTAVLLVEQRIREALQIAGRGAIMSGGTIVAQGPAPSLLADASLAERFLGG